MECFERAKSIHCIDIKRYAENRTHEIQQKPPTEWSFHETSQTVTILGVYFPFYCDISRVPFLLSTFVARSLARSKWKHKRYIAILMICPSLSFVFSTSIHSLLIKWRRARPSVVRAPYTRTDHDNAIVILNYNLAYFIIHFCTIITVMNFTQHNIQKLTRFIKTSKTDRSIDRCKENAFVLLTSKMRCDAIRFVVSFHG